MVNMESSTIIQLLKTYDSKSCIEACSHILKKLTLNRIGKNMHFTNFSTIFSGKYGKFTGKYGKYPKLLVKHDFLSYFPLFNFTSKYGKFTSKCGKN